VLPSLPLTSDSFFRFLLNCFYSLVHNRVTVVETGGVGGKPISRIDLVRKYVVSRWICLIDHKREFCLAHRMGDLFHMTEKDLGRGYRGLGAGIHLSAQIGDPEVGLACLTEVHILKTARRDILLTWRKGRVSDEKKGVIELGPQTLADHVLRRVQADLPFDPAIPQTIYDFLLDLGRQLGRMKITGTGESGIAFSNCLVFHMGLNSIHSPLLARALKDSRNWYEEIGIEAI